MRLDFINSLSEEALQGCKLQEETYNRETGIGQYGWKILWCAVHQDAEGWACTIWERWKRRGRWIGNWMREQCIYLKKHKGLKIFQSYKS